MRPHVRRARQTQPVRPLPTAQDPLWLLGDDVVRLVVAYVDEMTRMGL